MLDEPAQYSDQFDVKNVQFNLKTIQFDMKMV